MKFNIFPVLLAVAGFCAVVPARAVDLPEAWRAATRYDQDYLTARAAYQAVQRQGAPADTVSRPSVSVGTSTGTTGKAASTLSTKPAAPGRNEHRQPDVTVADSTTNRWIIEQTQPVLGPEARLQQQKQSLSAELANLQWKAANQLLILRIAEQYLELALAQEAQRLTGEQSEVVQAKRRQLANSTGLPAKSLSAQMPAYKPAVALRTESSQALDRWLDDARSGNLATRAQWLAVDAAKLDARQYKHDFSVNVDYVVRMGYGWSGGVGPVDQAGRPPKSGVEISVPVFPGGECDTDKDSAPCLVAKARAALEHTRQEVALQVRSVWQNMNDDAQRVQALAQMRVADGVGGNARKLELARAQADLFLKRLRLMALAGRLDEAALVSTWKAAY